MTKEHPTYFLFFCFCFIISGVYFCMVNFSQTFSPFEFDGAKSSATNKIYVYMHALYTSLSPSLSLSLI